jgi:type I restriction enzyme R subunit
MPPLPTNWREAGYTPGSDRKIKAEVDHASKVRDEVRLSSGDYIDLKAYEPAMRHLIDTYIRAEESEKISAFDDMSLIQLIVERGPDAAAALIKGVMKTDEAVAETIENNVRKLIINESPVDPAYYDKMSKLLDALIEQRRKGVVSYKEYLEKIAQLTKEATQPGGGPGATRLNVKTAAHRGAVQQSGQGRGSGAGGGRGGAQQPAMTAGKPAPSRPRRCGSPSGRFWSRRSTRRRRPARPASSSPAAPTLDAETTRILELAKHQNDY